MWFLDAARLRVVHRSIDGMWLCVGVVLSAVVSVLCCVRFRC